MEQIFLLKVKSWADAQGRLPFSKEDYQDTADFSKDIVDEIRRAYFQMPNKDFHLRQVYDAAAAQVVSERKRKDAATRFIARAYFERASVGDSNILNINGCLYYKDANGAVYRIESLGDCFGVGHA